MCGGYHGFPDLAAALSDSVLQVVDHILDQASRRMNSPLRLLEFTYSDHRGWLIAPGCGCPAEEFGTQSHLDFLNHTVTAMYRRRTLMD